MTTGGSMGGEGQVDVLYVDVQAQINERSFDQMEQQVSAAGDRAGKAGGGALSAGLTGLVAGATATVGGLVAQMAAQVGAVLAQGITEPLKLAQQARQGVVELQASLGVTGEEAQRLGEVAKTVFGNNWTGSLAEAQAAVANVRREVQGLTDTELQAVTEGSVAIAQRFDEDQQKVAAAVQSVMKATGSSAQEAMDLITAGFQKGLNSSGDWLDTLNEYGPIFEKTGASGAELFSLLETGAAKGALGTDKVADSIKEFGFSLSDTSKGMVAAFAQLGISQSDLTAKIDSGAMTQIQAYQLVQDRLKGVQSETERMAIISQIFKGAGEDLGAVAGKIDITKTKMSDLSGTTQQVKDSYNTLGSVFQTAWRQVLLQLQPVGDLLLDLANDAMPAVKQAINTLGPVVTQVVQTIVRGFQQAKEGTGPLGQAITAVRPIVSGLGDLFQSVFGLIASLWQNVLRPALNAILPVVTTAFSGVSGVLNSALTLISGVINTVAALFRGDWAQAWEIFKRAATDAANRLQDTLDGIGAKIVEAGGAVFGKAAELGGKIRDGILSGIENLKYALASRVTEAINGILGVIPDWAKNMLGINGPVQMPAKPNTPPAAGAPASGEVLQNLGLGAYNVTNDFGNRYSFKDKQTGRVVTRTHDGLDLPTAMGTKVTAAFRGYLTAKFDRELGHYFDLVDAQGNVLRVGHLQGFPPELLKRLQAAGGKLLVEAGEHIANTGNSGMWTTGPHAHVEAFKAGKLREGQEVDPRKVQFVNVAAPSTSPAAPVTVQPKTVPPVQTPDAAPKTVPITVPLPTPAEQKAYSLSLADWNKQSKEALEIARQLIQAEVSKDQGFILRVRARAKAYEEEGTAQAASLAFASEQLKKADDAAIASKRARAEAAKKTETAEKETDLQREQRLAREQAAQDALEKSIRNASAARLKDIIAAGVQKTGDLERINMAEAELERRGQLEEKSRQQAKAAREKATREELADQQELAERTVKAMQERQARLSRINQLTRQGNIEAARLELAELERQREADLRSAGESAQARLQVEKSAAQQIYLARKVVLDKEKLDRDAAIKNDATLTPALRKLQLDNSQKTYDGLLTEAAQTRASRVAAAEKLVADAMEKAAENARAAGERQSKSLVDSLKARDKQMEEAAQNAQRAGEQQSDSLLKGMQARDKQLEAQQKTAAQALAAGQQQGDSLLKKLRERTLADYGDFATRYVAIAERMAEGGDYAGSINVLQVAIADLLETSDGSETATAALSKLGDALDRVSKARQGLTGDAKAGAEFREAIGVDTGELTEVAARGTRPTVAPQPVQPVAARPTAPVQAPSTATPARGATDESWRDVVRGDEQMAEAKRLYTASLRDMTDAQLAAEQATQLATGSQAKYQLAVEETARRVQEAADKQRAWDANFEAMEWDGWVSGLRDLSDAEIEAGIAAATAGKEVAKLNAYRAEEKRRADEAKTGTEALAQAQAELTDLLDTSNDGPYQAQLDMLTALGEKYPELGDEIDKLLAKYKELNDEQLKAREVNAKNLGQGFKQGREDGADEGAGKVLNVAHALGKLTSPLYLFGEILDKINPAGAILEGIFSVLAEPIKAIQEPLKIVGQLIGSVIAPILELFAPILKAVVDVLVMVYDAVADFVKTVTFGIVDITRRTPAGQESKTPGPAASDPASSTNALVTIPTSQVTVMATPQWVMTMERAANKLDSAADKLLGGIRVDVQAKVEGPKGGNLAYDLATGG